MLLAIHGLGSDAGAMHGYLDGAVPAGVRGIRRRPDGPAARPSTA